MSRVLAALLLLGSAACEQNDMGKECTGMVIPVEGSASSEGDVMRAQGSEIVEYNTAFPCESVVCVATLGRGGYCSQECSSDDNCPNAFRCREIMSIGPFAGKTFCAWRECTTSADCGDIDDYVCVRADELSLGQVVKLCDLRSE